MEEGAKDGRGGNIGGLREYVVVVLLGTWVGSRAAWVTLVLQVEKKEFVEYFDQALHLPTACAAPA